MNKVMVIALNTFREAIRDKILFALLFFGVGMLFFSVVLGAITIGDPTKVVVDMGLAGINLFGVMIAIFVGIGLVYKEMEKRTIHTLLSKPIARWQFLVGKYYGLIFTLLVEVTFMTLVLMIILHFYEDVNTAGLLLAIFMIFLELMVITALTILFSSFTTPFLSGVFTLAIYIIGHITGDLRDIASATDSQSVKLVSTIIYYIFPNLENFNIKHLAVYGLDVKPGFVFFSIVYAIVYVKISMFLSMVIFQKKDLK